MNEIYDVLVNWNTLLFEFYEWSLEDEITHLRKVPIVKVNSQIFYDLYHSKIAVSKTFLKKIDHKCECYASKKRVLSSYISLFSDGNSVLAITFDENGKSILKSKLLLDEEEEVLGIVVRMNESDFPYEVLESEQKRTETRYELERESYLKLELKALQKKECYAKLQYLFYDCYGEKEAQKEKMFWKLWNDLCNHKGETIQKMEDFFKKISFNK